MSAPDLIAIAALRARAWANGWRPMAVLPWDFPDPEQAGKAPLGRDWPRRARQDPPECTTLPAVEHAPNTGILTDGLRGIDIDVDDPPTADAIQGLAFNLLGATIVRTRDNSGRRLLPYRAAEGSPKKRAIAGKLGKVEILGLGQQFVAFGIHKTGAQLRWYPACPASRKVSEVPAVTEEKITAFLQAVAPLIGAEAPAEGAKTNGKAGPHNHRPNSEDDGASDIRDVAAALEVIPNDGPADWEHWNCVGMAVWRATNGCMPGFDAWAMWSAKHPEHDGEACAKRWQHYPESAPDRTGAGKLFKMAVEAKSNWKKPSEDWQKYLQREDGQPITNLANAATALRQAPELKGIVTYDLMLRQTLATRSLPGSRMEKVTEPRPVKDTDVTAVQEWLQRHDMRRMGKETVHQAIDLVAQEHAFHPIRNYLNGLQWDGESRLGGWLNVYLGVDHSEYAKAIGTMFLIAMVARIYKPGCKADYMPVLESSDQGTLKSTVCATLAGEWFSDNLPDVTSGKDVSVHLNGKWLIEIGELSAMNRAEANAIKTFITRQTERYRPPYGREEIVAPRQCVFVGTTNAKTYLKDETGGRRFWPIEAGMIDVEGLARDRDQLFAEAVRLYRNGAQWWPNRDFELEHIRPEQDARFEDDAWMQPIAGYVDGLDRTTVMNVARDGLHIDTGKVSKVDQARIKAALQALKWRAGRKTMTGVVWLRPGISW